MDNHGVARTVRRQRCFSFFSSAKRLMLVIYCILLAVAASSSSSTTTLSSTWKYWNVWSLLRTSNNQTLRNVTKESRSNAYTTSAANASEEGSNDDDVFGTTTADWTKQRSQFLERIAVLASSLMRKETSMLDPLLNDDSSQIDLDAITPQSDLSLPGRHIHIVTTAALPWFTGTAVNPLLRAAYLHRKTQEINAHNATRRRWVTLLIPWLELPEDQKLLYNGRVFASAKEQERYIRDWLIQEADMPDAACEEKGLEILFYPGRYHTGLGSIFAMGDIIDTIVNSDATNTTIPGNTTSSDANQTSPLVAIVEPRQLDVCILEEPEHCNWYRAPGDGWTKRFHYVVGIVHTSMYMRVKVCSCISSLVSLTLLCWSYVPLMFRL
jgi:hypothetical protein